MARSWLSPSMVRWSSGLLASVAMVAAVTGVIVLLERHIPVLNLLVLYLLPVLSVAIFWGSRLAAVTAVLSVGAFALLLPPRGLLQVADARNVAALAVFLVTAVVVGELAARFGGRLWSRPGCPMSSPRCGGSQRLSRSRRRRRRSSRPLRGRSVRCPAPI